MLDRFSRRSFLRAGGVALALPALDLVRRGSAAAEAAKSPKRMIFICTSLGLHVPFLIPQETGSGYKATPYLEIIDKHRDRYTVFSGLSHPDQAGANGHTSEQTWLTSVRHPGLGGFRNAISVDQLAAESIGVETRFPSLQLSTGGNGSQSYTRSGVMIPSESKPSKVFAKLFLDGTQDEIGKQVRNLRQGRSILDAVSEETKRLERRIGTADRERLDEYLSSVREMETRLAKSEEWVQKPKPPIDAKAPDDIADERDLIGRMGLLMDLIPLAVQTDSTRLITVLVQGRNDVPTVPGVTIDHHNLSHHGQDPAKIEQLKLIETALFRSFDRLLTSLSSKTEAGATLLDNTMVVFGSNLGNANSHDTRNLPLVFAGGGLKHGTHTAFDAKSNKPFSNLFVTMMQKAGLEIDRFGSSTGTLDL